MDLPVTSPGTRTNQSEADESPKSISTATKAEEQAEINDAPLEKSPEASLINATATTEQGTNPILTDSTLMQNHAEATKLTRVVGVAAVTEVEEATSQDLPEISEAKPVPSKKLCGICSRKEAKYKCSRCALPFCSVACSTIHKANHPASETKSAPPVEPKADPKTHAAGTGPRPGTVAAAGFKGPFAALDESKELRALFKMYPRLPALLDEINSITLPPASGTQGGENRGQQRRKEEPWNSDLGLRKGVEALTRARNSDGKDGESLREYSQLVLQVLSGENGQSTAELIQKELAEENAKIIERLLQGES